MAIEKRQKFCSYCERKVLAERDKGIGDGFGCLLTILTGGLFLILWIPLIIINSFGAYRCPVCGSNCGRMG